MSTLKVEQRLLHGTRKERTNWRLIARGEGIHWPDLDEDISVEDLLEGRPSGETQTSLQGWLDSRKNRRLSRRAASKIAPQKTIKKCR
jgi:hypothetical protein